LRVGNITGTPPDNLFGTVTNSSGKPIQNVVVTLISTLEQEIINRTTTNAKGYYELTLNGNQVAFVVSRSGFKTVVKNLFLNADEAYKHKPINFVLETWVTPSTTALQSIEGKIVDSKGLPISDAIVTLMAGSELKILSQTVSDINGFYKLALPNNEQSILIVSKPGYKSVSETLFANKATIDVSLTLIDID
jgi:hypothetical protein